MIGAMPSGLFGLTPAMMPQPGQVAPQQAPQSFQWGAGGSMVTPEQIAMQQKIAMQNQQAGMDTSPVGSWTQGLARVAQALVGNMQAGRANKLESQQYAASQAIMQNLIGGGAPGALPAGAGGVGGVAGAAPTAGASPGAAPMAGAGSATPMASGASAVRMPGSLDAQHRAGLLAAISNPYLGSSQREALKLEYQAGIKDPKNDPMSLRYFNIAHDPSRSPGEQQQAQQSLEMENDPMILTPQGLMRRSDAIALTGGGGQSSPVPTAPVGKLTPIGGAPSQGGATFSRP